MLWVMLKEKKKTGAGNVAKCYMLSETKYILIGLSYMDVFE